MRGNLLSLACSNGDETCLEGAYQRFKSWIDDPTKVIHPNLRSLVYQYGIKKAGYDEWEILLNRYMNELNASEKKKMLSGLCSTDKDWIVHRFLRLSKNETVVRSQDYFTALMYIARNPSSLQIVWTHVKENWEYLVDRFTLNNRYLGRMVKYIGTEFTTEFELKDVSILKIDTHLSI